MNAKSINRKNQKCFGALFSVFVDQLAFVKTRTKIKNRPLIAASLPTWTILVGRVGSHAPLPHHTIGTQSCHQRKSVWCQGHVTANQSSHVFHIAVLKLDCGVPIAENDLSRTIRVLHDLIPIAEKSLFLHSRYGNESTEHAQHVPSHQRRWILAQPHNHSGHRLHCFVLLKLLRTGGDLVEGMEADQTMFARAEN